MNPVVRTSRLPPNTDGRRAHIGGALHSVSALFAALSEALQMLSTTS